MKSRAKTSGHKGRCVRGVCRGEGDERSESKWADWQCLNRGVTCTPGSPFSSLKCYDQNGFKLREERLRWREMNGWNWEKSFAWGKKENDVFFSPSPPLPHREKCISRIVGKRWGGHSSTFSPSSTCTITGRQSYNRLTISEFSSTSRRTGCYFYWCQQLNINTYTTEWFNIIQGLSDVHEICKQAQGIDTR